MTTNMSEVFNSVLKGAHNLTITALVQLTFFRLNSYFVARKKQGANRLTSDEQYTSYVDAQIRPMWLRLDQWKLFFIVTSKDDFMSSQGVVEHSASTYMTRNAHVVRHLYIDYLFKVTTLRSRTMILRQACFIPYSMKMSGLFMMVPQLYLLSQWNA